MSNNVRPDIHRADPANLGQSSEDYLEAVLVIGRSGRRVRVTDIAEHLGVTKPSVSSALAGLEDKGLVRHERYGEVQLTAAGAVVAEEMFRRHRLLHEFLRDVIGVPDRVAVRDACRVEHVLSPETLERLVRLVEFARARGDDERFTLRQLGACLERGDCGPDRTGERGAR
jgi:DtxR family Mn-dependent transcriptional regulator